MIRRVKVVIFLYAFYSLLTEVAQVQMLVKVQK